MAERDEMLYGYRAFEVILPENVQSLDGAKEKDVETLENKVEKTTEKN
jgi:hypothetical protein